MPEILRSRLSHSAAVSALGNIRTDTWQPADTTAPSLRLIRSEGLPPGPQYDEDCDCACAPSLTPAAQAHIALNPGALYYDEDCDCACALSLYPAAQAPVALNPAALYAVHPHLHTRPLNDTFQVAFHPYADAAPVVLNQALASRLQAFQQPRPLSALWDAFTDTPDAPVTELARRLVASHLLDPVPHTYTRAHPAPEWLTVWLHTTNDCNLRCTYCYLHKTDEPMSLALGQQSVRAALRTARLHHFGGVKFKYAGGEATLNLDTVLQLHAFALAETKRANLACDGVILSNGVGLTRDMLERIRDTQLRLMISLDGVGSANDSQRVFFNGRGSFTGIDRTIERAQRAGLAPLISITLSDQNIDALPQTVEYVLDRNLPLSLNFYRENDCSASFDSLQLVEDRMIRGLIAAYAVIEKRLPHYSLLGALLDKGNLTSAHDRPCGVGVNYMVIDQHGRIAKCHMDIANPVTDIHATDPLRILQTSVSRLQNPSVDTKAGCRDCQWKYWCAGGCPLATYRATGRYNLKSPNCRIYKAIYPQVLRLEGLRLLKYQSSKSISVY